MKKRKIVLADTDENYLLPFITKFLDENDDTIELIVITDMDYYGQFFSQPQEIDIMLMSEYFYSESIRRHSISSIFVLSENPDVDSSTTMGEVRLFKYSSIPGIYNRIVSSGKIDSPKVKETNVVLFYSASGGSGKTSVALAVSEFIAKNYKRVIYINAEQMNTFYRGFAVEDTIPNNIAVRIGKNPDRGVMELKNYVKKQSFDYLPPFSSALSSLDIPFSIYERFIDYLKGLNEYDYIIVDTDSVWNLDKANLVAKANKVVIITNQTASSVFSTNILLKNMICSEKDKFYFICNKFNNKEPNAYVSSEEKAQYMISGYVPYINNYETLGWKELSNDGELQKIAFLTM